MTGINNRRVSTLAKLAGAPDAKAAGLRMNVIGNPGIDKATFELYSLAVSAINGCGACVHACPEGKILGLIDGKGFVDDKGQTVFSYAHPLFWAPYSIIGDGS